MMTWSDTPVTARTGQKIVFYLHGDQVAGETELAYTFTRKQWHTMDRRKPDEEQSKSQWVTNLPFSSQGSPNPDCAGNGLLPVWRGDMRGRIKGKVTLLLHTQIIQADTADGAVLQARLFADSFGSDHIECVEDQPVGKSRVRPSHGQDVTKLVFENVDFSVLEYVQVQLWMETSLPEGKYGYFRIYYDGQTSPSSLTFTCIPPKGRAKCVR
jgi:hypothetical protein